MRPDRPFRHPAGLGVVLSVAVSLAVTVAAGNSFIQPSQNQTYRNPIIFADYSDPDVVRVNDDFYLVASSFNVVPGLPILHSRDLVNWTIVGHAAPLLPSPRYDTPQHGMGVWAPSLRHHAGKFWIYFGDPDLGIFMTTATDPRGPWAPLTLVQSAKGWIDPCPLWDDDGRVYLVHAWAKSRAGFNSILTVRELSADGTRVLPGDGVNVFDGTAKHPTIEGPKFYKRHGYYYIFAPAGGVTAGWQTVLRSRKVLGPYDDRIVLQRGATDINGPHQGGWVDTASGESWFVHFQDRGAYGRIVHLQPMTWRDDDWPVIGADPDGDGVGEPVLEARKPTVRAAPPTAARVASVPSGPQTSDEFSTARLGLQWQWQANPSPRWWSLTARPGSLRLVPQALPDGAAPANLWSAPNLLLQKLPAESFEATAAVSLSPATSGAAVALVAMGLDYTLVRLRHTDTGFVVESVVCRGASESGTETVVARATGASQVQLRLSVAPGAVAQFSYSLDGTTFAPLGERVMLREGRWMGAKFGLVATRESGPSSSVADIDWLRVK